MSSFTPPKPDFSIFVLGLKGRFRNQQEIDRRSSELQIVQVDALTPESPEIKEIDSHARVFHFWYNRNVTLPEVACALSHRRIIDLAYFENKDFVLILEDDAVIPTQEEIENHARILRGRAPILLSLASNLDAVLLGRRKSNIFGQKYSCSRSVPTHTQAYALNRSAIELIHHEQKIRKLDSLADFPPWYSDLLDFIMYMTPAPIAPSNNSVIGNDGRNSENSSISRRVYRFSLLAWLIEGRRYCGLVAYIRFVHGRAIGSLQMKHRNR